jgi:hypothetical protein
MVSWGFIPRRRFVEKQDGRIGRKGAAISSFLLHAVGEGACDFPFYHGKAQPERSSSALLRMSRSAFRALGRRSAALRKFGLKRRCFAIRIFSKPSGL